MENEVAMELIPSLVCALCFKNVEEAQALYGRDGKPFGSNQICAPCRNKVATIFDICPQCDKAFVNLQVWGILVDGKRLCISCGLIGKKICFACQEAKDEADVKSIELYSAGWAEMCSACIGKLRSCAGCNAQNIMPSHLLMHSGRKNAPGDGFCVNCYDQYYWCCACKTIKHKPDDTDEEGEPWNWDGSSYCLPCFNLLFARCADCDSFMPKAASVTDESDGEQVCLGCYNQRTRHRVTAAHKAEGNIFNYRFDVPRGLNVKIDPKKKLFGVELEVCVPESDEPQTHAAKVYSVGHDMVVCKSDSSIRYGFEIVTAPLEMAPLQNVLRDVLKVKTLQEHSTCGMHVHMNRHTIPRPAIAKTILFMHEPGNRGFINWVARRDAEYYASLSARKWKDAGLFEGVNEQTLNTHIHEVQNVKDTRYVRGIPQHMRRTTGWQNGGRYQAINLCNKNTIEFRVFAATTDPEMACANLEFCQALIDYTSELRPMAQVKSAKDFVEYVKVHRKTYPAFHTRLEKEADAVTKALTYKPRQKKEPTTMEGSTPPIMPPTPGHCNHAHAPWRCNRAPGHLGPHRRTAANAVLVEWE